MADLFKTLGTNLGSNLTPILTTKPTARFVSGARCILRINGQLIGFAFGISWKISTMQDEIWTIDDYLPYELAPSKISIEGTLSAFHIPGRGASAEYMQANVLSYLFHQYIQIEVKDSATDNLLLLVPKAAITTRTESIKAENLATVTLSWKAIGWQDEIKPKYPKGYNANAQDINALKQNPTIKIDKPPLEKLLNIKPPNIKIPKIPNF